MNKWVLPTVTLIALILTLLNACQFKPSCGCNKDLGCKILTVEKVSTGDTILVKIFCSQASFLHDEILDDSVQAFYNQFQTDSTRVYSRDSIYKYDRVGDLTYNKSKSYSNAGYYCECAK